MQSVELQAVTQARASGDYHPGSNQWQVGISSIFADALAIRPTKDNFWSVPTESNGKVPGTDQCEAPYNNSCGKLRGYGLVNEPFNRLQAAVSTLTAGPDSRRPIRREGRPYGRRRGGRPAVDRARQGLRGDRQRRFRGRDDRRRRSQGSGEQVPARR